MENLTNTQEGRKAPLKDVEVPLQDRIVAQLFKKLESDDIGSYVTSQWEKGNARRSLWLERQQAYLSQWDEFLEGSTEGPFAGSSQLHLPITFVACKTLHARFMQAIWQDPPCHVRANNEASLERVAAVRDTLRYYLMKGANYGKGVGRVVDLWVWKWITAGSGIMKLRWDCTYTRFRDVRRVKKQGPPLYRLVNGERQMVRNLVDSEEEFTNEKKTFEGPVLEVVSPEDLLIIGGEGDPDAADEVHHRNYMTESQLWTLVDRKVFDRDGVEEAIEGGRNYKSGATGNAIKDQKAANAGQSSADEDAELDRFEIIEAYLKWDVDGSGITSDVIVWVHAKSKRLLRATYLYRVMRTGERPFVKADYHLRDGQEYGIGVPEILYPLAKEMDAIHNMRLDWGMLSTMPFAFYRATSSLDPKVIRLEPGALIPVDNPQTDVYFPNLGNRTAFGFQEEAALDAVIQRITGVNDMAMGVMSSQGATRTATGARALVGEMGANLDVHLRRLNFGWEKALRYLMHLLQQRIPAGLSYRLTGEDGSDYWRTVRNAEDIGGDFDLDVSPNSASSNQAIQQEMAAGTLQLVMNPLAIQLGIVQPQNVYEAMKTQLQAMGVKDWGRYLAKPQGYEYMLTPEQEANRVLRGQEVPVHPQADHEGFIAFYEMFEANDELMGQFPPEQIALLKIQAMKHARMMQALQQMQAQQANTQQMRMNAAQSADQTAPAMPAAAPQGGAGAPAAAPIG
jgi:hypothetical protein